MSATPTIDPRAVAHPCFDPAHRSTAARLHLPVAPRCNVQCGFCDRAFDCVNESRPGVTATLLTPEQAVERVERVRRKLPNLAVVGIAGPGDPLANPVETMETLRLVGQRHPDLALCLATNGLGLPGRAADLAELGVSHLTVTVNAVDPAVGSRLYSWIRYEGRARSGVDAAAVLLERQLRGIAEAAAAGMIVKINTILIPGVNEGEAGPIAREAAARGASFMNLIPLLPVSGTPLFSAGEPRPAAIAHERAAAAAYLPQLAHCARCRADAVGLLGKDIELDPETDPIALTAKSSVPGRSEPFLVAVASREGLLVNRHLGEADRVFIFRVSPSGDYETVDIRKTPGEGGGPARWEELAELVADCAYLFAAGLGAPPRRVLEARGIRVRVLEGLIGEALEAIAAGKDVSFFSRRAVGSNAACASGGCSGGASRGCGCA